MGKISVVAAVVLALQAAPAAAQQPVGDAEPGYQPAVRYPDSGFGFLGHSSTLAEGTLRGAGALARDVGAANLDHSLAAMNYQEAYRRSLENALKYAETYYARRDLWFDYREANRRQPLTMEGYQRLAEAKGASRLPVERFDPETGNIHWPDLLMADVLEPYRERIEQILRARSITDVGYGSRTNEQVRLLVDEMRAILDRNRRELPTHLYVNATRFLDSVEFESRFAPPDGEEPDIVDVDFGLSPPAPEGGNTTEPPPAPAPERPTPETPASADVTEVPAPDTGAEN